MDSTFIFGQIGHTTAALLFAGLVCAAYRYVQRQSAAVGAIFAIAILGRVALGSALFWISYLELPIAESLQLGGGFWRPFLDATGNYRSAAVAATNYQLFGFEDAVATPLFVNILAVWMMAVGISPAAGMFLNLCLYVLLVTLFVKFFAPVNDWRRDLPCLVGVGAYSFSPAVLAHSTQAMKEELACVLVGMCCFGALALTKLLRQHRTNGHAKAALIAVGGLATAVYAMAGIRWYIAFLIWSALAVVLTVFASRIRTTPLPRYLTESIAVLMVTWVAFGIGAGPYYRTYVPNVSNIVSGSVTGTLGVIAGLPAYLAVKVRLARAGFLPSGGGTNLVIPLREDSAPGEAAFRALQKAEAASGVYQAALAREAVVQARLAREAAVQERAREAAAQERLAREAAAQERTAAAEERVAMAAAAQARLAREAAAQERLAGAAAAQEQLASVPAAQEQTAATQELAAAAQELAAAAQELAAVNQTVMAAEQAGLAEPGDTPSTFLPALSTARNVENPERVSTQPPENYGQGIPINASEDVRAAGWGLLVFFAPITLLETMAGLDIDGGRGLLRLTDIDTVVMDFAILSVFALAWTRRRTIGTRLPIVLFSAILFGATALLLAYSVTNFGTLWRLRPMVVMPLWALTVALSSRVETPADTEALSHKP